jgi:hypothetical protein
MMHLAFVMSLVFANSAYTPCVAINRGIYKAAEKGVPFQLRLELEYEAADQSVEMVTAILNVADGEVEEIEGSMVELEFAPIPAKAPLPGTFVRATVTILTPSGNGDEQVDEPATTWHAID